ncbi:Aste57867_23109 [Aphanomyces stellatus]|uniref:Aste57867_23109 protein n=1 Tax=Aphanomyces stellatus TaxID=120398 RepID=A0A485LM21_9STRA|nr:hypothetical protein As57867_023038 [Aphanomyces stellatus]VFT99757.1 Aste57867_23109 [Aphanomyces stellatus]
MNEAATGVSWVMVSLTTQTDMIHAYVSGPPGSGKTTLCKKVGQALKLEHLSTGEILRENIKARTEWGRVAKKCIAAKTLVPDDVVVEMLAERVAKASNDGRGWVLDGFPRTVEQAAALRTKGIWPNVVLILELPSNDIRDRLVGRRFDPKTGDIYHAEFNVPRDPDVAARLIHRDDDMTMKIPARVDAYACYGHPTNREFLSIAYDVDADRPIADVAAEAMEILRSAGKKKSKSAPPSEVLLPSNQLKEAAPKATIEPEETEWSPPKSLLKQRPSSVATATTLQKVDAEIQRVVVDNNMVHQPSSSAAAADVAKLVDMERFKTMLVSGFDVIKHGRRGAPHTRTLFCDVEFKRLFWQKPDKKELKAKLDQSIALADVIQVVQGMKTDVFKRSGDTSKSDRYLSLIADDRTLDIEVASDELCVLLVRGLTAFLEA